MIELQKKEDPFLVKHLRVLRISLKTIGAWPTEAFGMKTHRILFSRFILVLTFCSCIGEINFVIRNFNLLSLIDLGDIFMTLLLIVLTFIRAVLVCMKKYGTITTEFIMKFHLVHYKHKGGYYVKICDKINDLSHYFTLLMVTNMIIGPTLFNLVPLYNNYIHGAYSQNSTENYRPQFSIYFLYPWFNAEDYLTAATLFNYVLCYISAVLVCAIDILLCLMAFQLIGHIKALLHDLQHIPKPKHIIIMNTICRKTNQRANLFIERYNSQENELIREQIVEFVKHHRLIVRFADSVSHFYGPMLAFNYLYHLIGCGLLLLECSMGAPDTFARYVIIAILTFNQLIQISMTFEIIVWESIKLKDVVYNIPWECMDISNQKLVWMFLTKIQVPIRVTALGMVEVGVKTMVAILKTTLSYFAVLRSMNE